MLFQNNITTPKIICYLQNKIKYLNLSQQEIQNKYKCEICLDYCYTEYIHTNCNKMFHNKCINNWLTYNLGEIITDSKLKCPCCKIIIKKNKIIVPNNKYILLQKEYDKLNLQQYYKFCKLCKKLFVCGDKTCQENINSFPDTCSNCLPKIITCPNCNTSLEHLNGCNDFACCLYGYDSCSQNCNHGSTENIKLCGHKWKLTHELMNTN